MYSLTLFALQVGQSIDLEDVGIGQEVVILEIEEGAASLGETTLEADEGRDVLVVLPQVVEQGHNLLTEDGSLDCLVACVHRVLPEALIRI